MKTLSDTPDKLPATDEQILDLKQQIGSPLVLFFYPKDNTPGCSQEVQDFRDYYPSFQEHGAQIIGVSRDTLKSHEKFKQKYQLPYPLIADTDERLCQHYEVIKEKIMFGKKARGIVRSTYLYDANGKLYRHWHKVKIPGHVEEVLAALKEMVSS